MAINAAVHSNRHLAAAFKFPEESPLRQASSAGGAMLKHLNDVENIFVVCDTFNAKCSLSHGME